MSPLGLFWLPLPDFFSNLAVNGRVEIPFGPRTLPGKDFNRSSSGVDRNCTFDNISLINSKWRCDWQDLLSPRRHNRGRFHIDIIYWSKLTRIYGATTGYIYTHIQRGLSGNIRLFFPKRTVDKKKRKNTALDFPLEILTSYKRKKRVIAPTQIVQGLSKNICSEA